MFKSPNLQRNVKLKVHRWPLTGASLGYFQLIWHFFLFFIMPLWGYAAVKPPCRESRRYAWRNVTQCQHVVYSSLIRSPISTILRTFSLSQHWRAPDGVTVWEQSLLLNHHLTALLLLDLCLELNWHWDYWSSSRSKRWQADKNKNQCTQEQLYLSNNQFLEVRERTGKGREMCATPEPRDKFTVLLYIDSKNIKNICWKTSTTGF